MIKPFSIAARLLILGSFLTSAVIAEQQSSEVGSFSIAAVADIQYADANPRGGREPREGVARIKNAISHWNKRDLDWGVVLGDIIDWDDIDYSKFPKETVETSPKEWKNTRAILAAWNTLKVPNYKVLGNHDYYVPYKDADGLSKPASVYRAFGFKDKAYYEFSHKGYRFIVLDGDMSYLNHDIESEEYKKAKAYYDALKGPAKGIWSAGISTKQMNWLKGILADSLTKKQPTVIMCHYPMHKPYDGHTLFNAAEMTTLLDKFPNVVMWLNGHDHRGAYTKIGDRHHLNLKGMQNEGHHWYQIDFGPESITVYQAEDLKTPKYELKLSWPLKKPAEAKWVTISSPAEFARIKTKTAGNWILQDGVISLIPRPGEEGWKRFGSYLWLAEDYGDFECEFEYQHEAGGNSGFYFRVADPKNPVKTGVELQLLDCHAKPQLGWHDLGGLIKQTKEGHQNPLAKATKPAGEWNTVSVSLKNKKLKVTINGITVQDRPHDPELAGAGKIGFQDHGLPFHIRNFKIRSVGAIE